MRKIYVLLSLMLFIFFISKTSYAASGYSFVWENTTVEVLVGDAIDNYLLIPKATLYKDGVKTDRYVGMLWGEDETDPDYIDTTRVGTYKLTYRAVSDIEEATTVIFNVVDRVAPEITMLSQIVIPMGHKISLDEYFNISDNYDDRKNIDVSYNDILVDYNNPGSYMLSVTATDSSGNYTTKDFSVLVKVLDGPKIEVVDDSFKISYGDTFHPSSYYRAIDSFGHDITSSITSSGIDTSQISGTITSKILAVKSVDFSVADSYGNKTSWSQVFYVVDESCPKIELTKDRIEITIGDVDLLNKEYFNNLISSIHDNYEVSYVNVEYSNVRKALGEYEVIYEVGDKSSNKVYKSLVVSVICDSSPSISVLGDIKIKKGGSVNYYRYLNISDKYDGDITMDASIDDSNVNYSKSGVYFVYVTSRNSYGKVSYQTITVRIYEGFWESYYYLFLIPIGIIGVVVFFVIKKKKVVI